MFDVSAFGLRGRVEVEETKRGVEEVRAAEEADGGALVEDGARLVMLEGPRRGWGWKFSFVVCDIGFNSLSSECVVGGWFVEGCILVGELYGVG